MANQITHFIHALYYRLHEMNTIPPFMGVALLPASLTFVSLSFFATYPTQTILLVMLGAIVVSLLMFIAFRLYFSKSRVSKILTNKEIAEDPRRIKATNYWLTICIDIFLLSYFSFFVCLALL